MLLNFSLYVYEDKETIRTTYYRGRNHIIKSSDEISEDAPNNEAR